jgi:membrane-associated two-gene conflict system component 1 (EACC1)
MVCRVRILVRVPEDTGDDSLSLYRWLTDESAVRRHGHLEPGAEPGGAMGQAVEWLSLVIGSGLSLGQLLVAIAAWRASRPRPVRVSVELPDRTITVDTTDPDEALDIARRLEAS